MSVDRRLGRFSPVKDASGDRVPSSAPGVPFPSNQGGSANNGLQGNEIEVNQGQMIARGPAYANSGNNFQGYPQHNMEVSADAQRAIGYKGVSGIITLDATIVSVYRLAVIGNTHVQFSIGNWPFNAYQRQADDDCGAGLDFAMAILIENPGGYTVTIETDYWAPYNEQPPQWNATYMEFGMAINWMTNFNTILRAFPAIRPAPVQPTPTP